MDLFSNTELPAFIDFCKSLDAAVVHTPEQAVQLYRSADSQKSAADLNSLARDLLALRQQIVESGASLLDEDGLDREKAARRGEKTSAE